MMWGEFPLAQVWFLNLEKVLVMRVADLVLGNPFPVSTKTPSLSFRLKSEALFHSNST